MVSITYVIGARNEANQVPSLFRQLDERLADLPGSRVVLVENGSVDSTYDVAREVAAQMSHVAFEIRQSEAGLGNAVRVGVQGCGTDVAVITAADLPFGFSDLDRFLGAGCPRLAVGSKNHPDSKWPQDVHRSLMSTSFRATRALLFGLGGLDTQGSVFVSSRDLEIVAPALVSSGYFISTEIVLRARALGASITYLPVDARGPLRPSHVSTRDGAAVLKEMVAVRRSLQPR